MKWFGMLALLASVSLASPVLATEKNWKADWDKTVAAANQEGELVAAGPSGRGWRDFLIKCFSKDYPKIVINDRIGLTRPDFGEAA